MKNVNLQLFEVNAAGIKCKLNSLNKKIAQTETPNLDGCRDQVKAQ